MKKYKEIDVFLFPITVLVEVIKYTNTLCIPGKQAHTHNIYDIYVCVIESSREREGQREI